MDDDILITEDENLADDAELDDEDLDDDDDEDLEDEPTLTFKVENGRIRSKVDEQAAMVQAIDKVLQTERFVYPIYSDQYGNDFDDLIGKNMAYAKTEVERMLEEALLADDRVTNVEINAIEETERDALTVKGSCETVYGNVAIDSEVKIVDGS